MHSFPDTQIRRETVPPLVVISQGSSLSLLPTVKGTSKADLERRPKPLKIILHLFKCLCSVLQPRNFVLLDWFALPNLHEVGLISTLGTVPYTQGPPENLQTDVPESLRKENREVVRKGEGCRLGHS